MPKSFSLSSIYNWLLFQIVFLPYSLFLLPRDACVYITCVYEWDLNAHQEEKTINIFEMLKEKKKNCQARILYTEKISFKTKGEIKRISDKWKLRFVCTRSAPQMYILWHCMYVCVFVCTHVCVYIPVYICMLCIFVCM